MKMQILIFLLLFNILNLKSQWNITDNYIETKHNCISTSIGKHDITVDKIQLTMSFEQDTIMDLEGYILDSTIHIYFSFFSSDSVSKIESIVGPQDSIIQIENGYLLKLIDTRYPRYIYFLKKNTIDTGNFQVENLKINSSYIRHGMYIYFSDSPK